MIVYVSLFVAILALAEACRHLEARSGRPCRKGYIVSVSILLILQSGLRHVAVGSDTYCYYEYSFKPTLNKTWSNIFDDVWMCYVDGQGKDAGYIVLQKLVQYITPHYQLFLILIAVVFFSALASFIYRNTKTISDAALAYVLYCALFFSFFSVTGHRQTLATAVTLFAYEFIKRRKFLAFLIPILLAATIHKSVLVFVGLYFIAEIRNAKWFGFGVLICFPALFVFGMPVVSLLMSLGGYSDYSGEKGAYRFTIMLLLFDVVALWRIRTVLRQDPEARLAYNAFALAIVFIPLIWSVPAAMRIVQYFSIFMLLLAPKIVDSFRFESAHVRQVAYWCCIVALIALGIRSHWGFEYAFFWQYMELGDNYY